MIILIHKTANPIPIYQTEHTTYPFSMSSILSKSDKSKLRILRITPHVFTFMVCRFLNGEIDNMKNKSNKILFWISFIPYVMLIVTSLTSIKNGVSLGLFGNQTLHYGLEAYSTTFIITFFRLWYIFVACLICQIIILLIEKFKNKTKIKLYVLRMFIIYVLGDVPLFVEGV